MINPRVSVIVPSYNVEPYLAQCLDSLVVQDLRDIEVIVVNDGSSDETSQIAMRYAESHKGFRLINQDNRGLSEARNAGLREARGEFIGFVDGDDWVHSSMYRELERHAVKTDADLVIGDGLLYDHQTKATKPFQDAKVWASLRGKDLSVALDSANEPDLFTLDTSACRRLYRRSFLERLNFRFLPNTIFEDVPVHYHLLLNTRRVGLLPRPLYFYRTNRPGRITARRDETLFDVFKVLELVAGELARHQVKTAVWANFIWFQNWVLRWLRNQIAAPDGDEFDSRSQAFSAAFPAEAVADFTHRFAADQKAVEFVQAQRLGSLVKDVPRAPQTGHRQYAATRHLGNDPIGFFNRDPYTFTPDVWGWLAIEFGIGSVLDIGCGIGTNLKWFEEFGFEVLGVEGHPRAIQATLLPGKVVQHDFTKGPWVPGRGFDLCLCTEFAEHVGQEFEKNWLEAVRCCRFLLLSAAPPGQMGYNHVNLKDDTYWIGRFTDLGFTHMAEISERLRATCRRKPSPWGRNQFLFFRQSGEPV